MLQIYSYQGPNEDLNEGRTPAPNGMTSLTKNIGECFFIEKLNEWICSSEIQASTPVAVQNDIIEDDEELLNEDDDDDELDDLESGEDMNTQHLVLAQFDKVNDSCLHMFRSVCLFTHVWCCVFN